MTSDPAVELLREQTNLPFPTQMFDQKQPQVPLTCHNKAQFVMDALRLALRQDSELQRHWHKPLHFYLQIRLGCIAAIAARVNTKHINRRFTLNNPFGKLPACPTGSLIPKLCPSLTRN